MRFKTRLLPIALTTIGALMVGKVATLYLDLSGSADAETSPMEVAELLGQISTAAGGTSKDSEAAATSKKSKDSADKKIEKSDAKQSAKDEKNGTESKHASAADEGDHAAGDSAAHAGDKASEGHDGELGLDDENFDPMMLTRAEIELLQGLSARRAELEKRERDFAVREQALIAAEKKLDEKIAALNEVKKTVESLLKTHEKEEDERIKSLVKIYESMKPKEAARILDGLDAPTLLAVVERMKESKTALILALLNPDRAKQITEELVSRNKLPGADKTPAAESDDKKAAASN